MTLGDILGIIAVVVLVLWTLCSCTVLTVTLGGDRVQNSVTVLLQHTAAVAARGSGLLVAAVIVGIIFKTSSQPIEKIAFGLILVGFAMMALYGMSVVTTVVASRLYPHDSRHPSARALFNSAALCTFGSLAPFIGWLIVAPSLIALAMGASSTVVWPLPVKTSGKNQIMVADERAIS